MEPACHKKVEPQRTYSDRSGLLNPTAYILQPVLSCLTPRIANCASSKTGLDGNMQKNKTSKTIIEKDGLETFVPYLLNRVTHRYNQMQHADLRAIGLTVVKMRALASLAVHGTLTINELCIHALAEQPTMSRTIDAMAQEGLVTRNVSPDDQRARHVSLTPQGYKTFVEFWPVMSKTSDKLSKVLSDEEKAQFLDFLKRIFHEIRPEA